MGQISCILILTDIVSVILIILIDIVTLPRVSCSSVVVVRWLSVTFRWNVYRVEESVLFGTKYLTGVRKVFRTGATWFDNPGRGGGGGGKHGMRFKYSMAFSNMKTRLKSHSQVFSAFHRRIALKHKDIYYLCHLMFLTTHKQLMVQSRDNPRILCLPQGMNNIFKVCRIVSWVWSRVVAVLWLYFCNVLSG